MALKREERSEYRIGKRKNGEYYHLRICDHIMDNIYGQIGITELEKEIERLPVFKRLHSISQLGLVNWIFPCALHTRYTHSIGVMHISGLMAEHINQNMQRQGSSPFFDDDDRQIIRLAGMLHDIGHYPLSHNVEEAYKKSTDKTESDKEEILKKLEYYNNCPDFLNPEKEGKPIEDDDLYSKFYNKFVGSKDFHHEYVGKSIIEKNKDIEYVVKWCFVLIPSSDGKEWVLNPKFAPQAKGKITQDKVDKIVKKLLLEIGNMVIGNYQYLDGTNDWNKKYSAMVQIIHSDMDADNLDYLLRDATFSGTSYGVMDMGVLLNSLTIGQLVYKQGTEEETRYVVGVRKKGLGSVDQFFYNRYLAYTQMIYSKYTSILEAMLLRFVMETVNDPDEDYSADKLKELLEKKETTVEYLKFSDYYFFNKIFEARKQLSSMRLFPRATVSHLRNSHAFDLVDAENECICTGTGVDVIKSEMENSTVYKRFKEACEKAKGKTGAHLRNGDDALESELLSYRFEQYALTKQVPLSDYLEEINNKSNKKNGVPIWSDKLFNMQYYRLGTGVPILSDGKVYNYDGTTNKKQCEEMLPQLCVDCPQSNLHEMYKLRYVSLRQYKICEYSGNKSS